MKLDSIMIVGKKVDLQYRRVDDLKGLNVVEKLTFDFYEGEYKGTVMLFVSPKGNNPTPKKCAITADRLSQLFNMPVVFILAPSLSGERQRLMEKGVYFVMNGKYAHLPMLVAMEKVSSRKIADKLTPVAQYLLLYHLQIGSIENMSISDISALMPYSYESVSLGVTCLADVGLCEKVSVDSRRVSVRFNSTGKQLWADAGKYLIDPVERRMYCDEMDTDAEYPICGINALAKYSMLNPDKERWIMMTAKESRELTGEGRLINLNSFDGSVIIEEWKYPPIHELNTSVKIVDPLSLALSLKNDEDPRVEEEVERMMETIKW